jgi:hypothetical protein
MRALRSLRAAAGFTMVETVVASACTLLVLGLAIPAFTAAGDAGDQGATKVLLESETRHALLHVAREIENTSTTAVNSAAAPRLVITEGDVPVAMVQGNTANDMGGFEGTLGSVTNGENSNVIDAATDVVGGTAATLAAGDAHESTMKGSGSRGPSQWGRERGADQVGTRAVGAGSTRPRHAIIAKNSIVSFQKVTGFTVDASGAPSITWSTPITYRVVGRRLVRFQDGLETVVCPVCVGFKAELSDAGTVLLTIVSQKRTHAKGRVVAEAAQIEVCPKN